MTEPVWPPAVGGVLWAIGDGWIPPSSTGPQPGMRSHETICVLNAGEHDSTLRIWFYFANRDPVGPVVREVPARRVRHLVVNDIDKPEPLPHGVDYSVVVQASHPVVVQHTRMDTRQAANTMMSTIAYS